MVSSLALSEVDRGIGGAIDREFGRNEMGMSRNNFGDSFERGMGQYLLDCPKDPVKKQRKKQLSGAQLTMSCCLFTLCRKFPWDGPHELWNGPARRQLGPDGRNGSDGHGAG